MSTVIKVLGRPGPMGTGGGISTCKPRGMGAVLSREHCDSAFLFLEAVICSGFGLFLGRILRAITERRQAGRRWQYKRDLGQKLGSSLWFSFPIMDDHSALSCCEALVTLQ